MISIFFLSEVMSKLKRLIEPELGFKTLTFFILGDPFKSNTILDVSLLNSEYLMASIIPIG